MKAIWCRWTLVVFVISLLLPIQQFGADSPPATPEKPLPSQRSVQGQIATLEQESLEVSLKELAHVDMFFWSRAPRPDFIVFRGFPLSKDKGQLDLEMIMSNRRFRKVLPELDETPKALAAELVGGEIRDALKKYSQKYDEKLRQAALRFAREEREKGAGQPFSIGPAFTIGDAQRKGTLLGERLKILGLLWVAGLLELDIQEEAEAVARIALKQRSDLYDNPDLHLAFKSLMLEHRSLYNRQIISSALLGIIRDPAIEASFLDAAEVQWQERKLVRHITSTTEYDWPRFRAPDPLPVRYLSAMGDDEFDHLMQQFNLLP